MIKRLLHAVLTMLLLGAGPVAFRAAAQSCTGMIFADGFESGDTSACTFYLYARELGGEWQQFPDADTTFERPDLPGVLQVGAMAYANGNPPDVAVTFESIDFESVSSVAGCIE